MARAYADPVDGPNLDENPALVRPFYLNLNKEHPAFVAFRRECGINQAPTALSLGTRREATDATTFNAAVAASVPGDAIEFPVGAYNLGTVTIPAENPGITILPKDGPVMFTGTTKFSVNASDTHFYRLGLSGSVTGGIEFGSGTTGGKILYCDFSGYGDSVNDYAIIVKGDGVEIAYSLFYNMKSWAFNIHGPTDLSFESRDAHIHHNEFTNYIGAIGSSSITQVGLAGATYWGAEWDQGFSNRIIFEYNYVDGWDGDPELISLKSSDNIIRYNYIINNHDDQHLNVRVGKNNLFYGNYVECTATSGVTYGWRVSGDNNWFIYNMVTIPSAVFGISTVYFNASGESAEAEMVASNNVIQHNVFENFDRDTTVTDNSLSPLVETPYGNKAIQNFYLGRTVVDTSENFSFSGATVTWDQWRFKNTIQNYAMPLDAVVGAYLATRIEYQKSIDPVGTALGTTVEIPKWFAAIGFDI